MCVRVNDHLRVCAAIGMLAGYVLGELCFHMHTLPNIVYMLTLCIERPGATPSRTHSVLLETDDTWKFVSSKYKVYYLYLINIVNIKNIQFI